MNAAHFHLIVNHFPIVGGLIGLLVLVAGYLLKKEQIKLTALGIFVFCGITVVMAHVSGENAEEIVEAMPGIDRALIHEHEEATELFYAITVLLGLTSIIGLYLRYRGSNYLRYAFAVTLLLSIASTFTSIQAGTSGGEIRHAEIRNNAPFIQLEKND